MRARDINVDSFISGRKLESDVDNECETFEIVCFTLTISLNIAS